MKILHVFRTPVGGLFRHVCDLAAAQAERGHQVGALYDSSTGDALSQVRLQTLTASCALGIHAVPMRRALSPGDVAGVLTTQRLARTLEADVLHGHGAKGGAFARLAVAMMASSRARPAAFYTPHGGSLHYDSSSVAGRIFLGLEHMLEKLTDGLIFESAYSAKVYRTKVGSARVSARIVPNGLQPSEFEVVTPATDAADFLYVGELRRLKGVDVLLRALARLQSRRPVSAVIVGAGPDAEAFHTLARDLGLSERVLFTGAMPARRAFPLGRTLVVPSRAESFPYIVLEAAAAGLPMIVTGVGGIPEIMAGTQHGMVAAGNAEALAQAMDDSLREPVHAAAAAARLREGVAARFTVSRMTDAVVGFYEEAHRSGAALHAAHSGVR